jgi:hypothetical protein
MSGSFNIPAAEKPLVYYNASTFFITDSGSSMPVPGYRECSFSFAQFDAYLEDNSPTDIKVVVLGNVQVLLGGTYTTPDICFTCIKEVIIPSESALYELYVTSTDFVVANCTINCLKNIDFIGGILFLSSGSMLNYTFKDIYNLASVINLTESTKINFIAENIDTISGSTFRNEDNKETLDNIFVNFRCGKISQVNEWVVLLSNSTNLPGNTNFNIKIDYIEYLDQAIIRKFCGGITVDLRIDTIVNMNSNVCITTADQFNNVNIFIDTIINSSYQIIDIANFNFIDPDSHENISVNIIKVGVIKNLLSTFINLNANSPKKLYVEIGRVIKQQSDFINLIRYSSNDRYFFKVHNFFVNGGYKLYTIYNLDGQQIKERVLTISGHYLSKNASLLFNITDTNEHSVCLRDLYTYNIGATIFFPEMFSIKSTNTVCYDLSGIIDNSSGGIIAGINYIQDQEGWD